MSIDKAMYALSNVNAILGSGLTYQQRLQNGEAVGPATAEFGMNILSGAMRNEIARDIRHTTGSNLGYLVNNMAGYGTPEANYKGTAGLMATSLFTTAMSPWNYGCGGFFGGPPMFGSIFGGFGCNTFITPVMPMPIAPPPMPYFGGFSFFGGGGGCWC